MRQYIILKKNIAIYSIILVCMFWIRRALKKKKKCFVLEIIRFLKYNVFQKKKKMIA